MIKPPLELSGVTQRRRAVPVDARPSFSQPVHKAGVAKLLVLDPVRVESPDPLEDLVAFALSRSNSQPGFGIVFLDQSGESLKRSKRPRGQIIALDDEALSTHRLEDVQCPTAVVWWKRQIIVVSRLYLNVEELCSPIVGKVFQRYDGAKRFDRSRQTGRRPAEAQGAEDHRTLS